MFRAVAVRRKICAAAASNPAGAPLRTGSKHRHHRNIHLGNARLGSGGKDSGGSTSGSRTPKSKMNKDELLKKLTEEEYRVTQEADTERPFTGKYWNHKEDGIYSCVVCSNPLFSSKTKYDSGSGWPSFYDALKSAEADGEVNVIRRPDNSHGMNRIEVLCKNCNAHLGHEFHDGPVTGIRYCINSSALCFQAKK